MVDHGVPLFLQLLLHALDELRALGERTLPEIRLASATTTMAPP
ncbi:MAG: hypothetical protein ABI547_03830 [Betaproteobacteria bacterium]